MMEYRIEDNLFGRLSVIEFLVAQCYQISIRDIEDKAAFLADTKSLLLERIDRLPVSVRPHAQEAADTILSPMLLSLTKTSGEA